MYILTKYIFREIIRHFCTILGLVIIIYLAVDFFERIDNFLKAGVPVTRAFWFFLFKTPLIITQMLPISLLLAILVTFGIMSKRNELVALKSSGVSIFHLFKSVAVLGILGSALLFFLSEIVVPTTMPRANRIWLQDVKKKGGLAIQENKWIPGENAFFKIGQYNPSDRVVYEFTAYYLDDQFGLERRLDAERGEFVAENRWEFQNLLVQEFDPKTDVPDVVFYDRQTEEIKLQPEDLSQIAPKTDQMSCKALRAYIEKTEAAGDYATEYRVDLHYKMAFPVACLIMCLIGTGVAVRRKLKAGLPVIVASGIGIAFLYYVVLSFCAALGNGGILPPWAAGWAAHFIFLCVGGVTLINAE
jgi:lipopolysaccharide export system permease protein